jgi:hypothetical protein
VHIYAPVHVRMCHCSSILYGRMSLVCLLTCSPNNLLASFLLV